MKMKIDRFGSILSQKQLIYFRKKIDVFAAFLTEIKKMKKKKNNKNCFPKKCDFFFLTSTGQNAPIFENVTIRGYTPICFFY